MINENLINQVKERGTFRDEWQGKEKVLREIGFRTGEKADYAIIMGCVQPEAMPKVIESVKVLLDRLNISHTVLSKESCCGWLPFGQPAVMAKNEEGIARIAQTKNHKIEGFSFKISRVPDQEVAFVSRGVCSPGGLRRR